MFYYNKRDNEAILTFYDSIQELERQKEYLEETLKFLQVIKKKNEDEPAFIYSSTLSFKNFRAFYRTLNNFNKILFGSSSDIVISLKRKVEKRLETYKRNFRKKISKRKPIILNLRILFRKKMQIIFKDLDDYHLNAFLISSIKMNFLKICIQENEKHKKGYTIA